MCHAVHVLAYGKWNRLRLNYEKTTCQSKGVIASIVSRFTIKVYLYLYI